MATRASRPTIGLVLLTVISVLLSLVATVRPALATHTADPLDHPLVEPRTYTGPGNLTCSAVDQADYEFKINIENPNGTFNEDSAGVSVTPDEPTDFEVTLTTTNVGGTKLLKFESNLPVQSVFLKGGVNGSNLYDYAEYPTAQNPEPVTYDERLQVPGGSDISHVSFCFDELPLLPALEITKTPDGGIVNAGDPLSFSIAVTNTGDADALNVDIDDSLDSRFVWTDDKDECSINPNQVLHCDIATLAPDATFTVTVSAPTDGTVCGTIPNVAFAEADGVARINDPGDVTINCADIRIEKTPDSGDVEIGGAITFALTVHNDGTGEARGVVVTDSLPGSGWSIVAAETTLAGCALAGSSLSCGPDTLAGGASKKATVTRTAVYDTDCGPIDNTANVVTSNDGSDSDTGHVTVLCAGIDVDKTPDGAQVTAGDPATFTIVTTNTGNAAATGVELEDELPIVELGWTIVAAGTDWADCEIIGVAGALQTLSCGPESIGAGEDRTVQVTTTATADDCGLLNNPKAEATTTNDGSDEDAGSISVLCADIGVDKSPDAAEAYAGDDVAFTIVTTNLGDGEARDVELSDTLPAVANGWTIDDALTDWADCSITGAAGTQQLLECGPEDIAAGQGNARTVVVTTTATAEDCGDLINLAADVSTSNDGSDTDAGDMTILCPDVSIQKTAGDPVNAGGSAGFEITVTAGGNGTSTKVQVADSLIGEQADWTFDVTGANDSACSISADPQLLCDFGDLAAGTVITIALTYQTSADDCPSIANSATVTSDGDTNANNNTSERVTVEVDCPDLKVDKEPVESPISAGGLAEFTIVVWNVGPGTAHDVTVTDTAPEGTVWTVLDDDGFDCGSAIAGDQQTLTCELDELAPGEENARTIRIGYETSQDDCGTLDNGVRVDAGNEPQADAGDDNADQAEVVVECPGVNLVKTAEKSLIVAGETASYTITVWNEGPGTAFDVLVEDTIPAGWTFDDGGACDELASSTEVGEPEDWSCIIHELAVSEDMTGGIEIRVFGPTTRDDCGLLTNTAFASSSNSDDERTDTASVEVRCPTLILEKEADAEQIVISGPNDDLEADPAVVIWTLTYTLTNGPVTNAVISDELPAGLVYVDGSASDGGVYDESTNTLTWTFATLSESGSVTYQTEVDPETISRVAPTVNLAVISSDQTPEDEGEDQVTVTVEQELGGNPTPTPKPVLPDTATGIAPGGELLTVPVELLAAAFIMSLGALALANVRASRGRRR